jgi:hypothetical protein
MGGTYWSTDVWGEEDDERDEYLEKGKTAMAQDGIDQADLYATSGEIASLSNLSDSPVYILTGYLDTEESGCDILEQEA